MKHIFLACIFLTVSFSLLEAKNVRPTIEALLIIDTKSNIKAASENNERLLLTLLQQTAKIADMNFKATVFKGKTATIANVQRYLHSAKKRPHDLLFFYFSGHGMQQKSSDPWPCFFLSSRKEFLNMKEIISQIESLKSRFSLVLSDCCNSPALVKAPPNKQGTIPPTFDKNKCALGLKRLFRDAKGHIRATAATPGQYGVATEKGSLFTCSFGMALLQTSITQEPSWNDVFNRTASFCSGVSAKFSHILQIPYVDIKMKKEHH